MANDLDRLFRENLDQFETTPSASSWEQVQGQIAPKKLIWVSPSAIAAAVILLIVAGWMIWGAGDQTHITNDKIAEITHPVTEPATTTEVKIEIPEKAPKEGKKATQEKQVEKPAIKKITTPKPRVKRMEMNVYKTLAGITPSLEVSMPINNQIADLPIKEVENQKIKITYIASNVNTKPSGKIESFLNYLSEEVKPADLLADIRDAKDQILSRN
ncbi:MAG: hypothetical protein JXR10_05725 [Cyclobacteriaceae bacterium]